MFKSVKKFIVALVLVASVFSVNVDVYAATENDASQKELYHQAAPWFYGVWQTPDGDVAEFNCRDSQIYHVVYANEEGNNITLLFGSYGRDDYKFLIYRGEDNRIYMKIWGARSGELINDGIVKIEG